MNGRSAILSRSRIYSSTSIHSPTLKMNNGLIALARDLNQTQTEIRRANINQLLPSQGQTLFTRLNSISFRLQRSRALESPTTAITRAQIAQQLLDCRRTLVIQLSSVPHHRAWLTRLLEDASQSCPLTDPNNWAARIMVGQWTLLHLRLYPHQPLTAPIAAIENPQDIWWRVGEVHLYRLPTQ